MRITIQFNVSDEDRREIAEWADEEGMADEDLCAHWADRIIESSLESMRAPSR